MGRPKLPIKECAEKCIYARYKTEAKIRGIEFKLSRMKAFELFTQACHYCAIPPSNVYKYPFDGRIYLYSGIDRIDNAIGYQDNNCVACCRACNKAKQDMSTTEFITWAARVVSHSIGKL